MFKILVSFFYTVTGIVVAVILGLACICLPIIIAICIASCIFHGNSRNKQPATRVVTTVTPPRTRAVVSTTSSKKVDYPEVAAYNTTQPPPPPPPAYEAKLPASYPAQPPAPNYPAQPPAPSYPA